MSSILIELAGMLKKILSVFFLSSLYFVLAAQNSAIDAARDSLVAYAPLDSHKVNLLNDLSWKIHRVDLDSAFLFASQAKEMAREVNYPKGYGRALNLLAIVAIYNENRALADSFNREALAIGEEINDSTLISQCLNDLAANYHESGELEIALEYYQNALRYTVDQNISGKVFALLNISSLYLDDKKTAKAQEYLSQALDIAKVSGDSLVICLTMQRKGDFYYYKQDYEAALELYQQALMMSLTFQDKFTMLDCHNSIGNVYLKQQLFEQAIAHFQEALNSVEPEENPFLYKHLLYNSANAYFESQSLDKAILYAHRAQEVALKNNAHEIGFFLNILELLAEAYAQKGDYTLAYDYQKKYKTFSDSLYRKNSQEALAELEAKYQVEQKDHENKLLQAQKEKSQLALKNHRIGNIALALGLLLTLSFIAFFWRSYHKKQLFNNQLQEEVKTQTANLLKANEELKNSNEELERFNHIASHDLKEPLRNIIGYVDLIQRNAASANVNPVKADEYFQFVKSNAHRLYKLVEDVLEISKVKHSTLAFKQVDVNRTVNQVQAALAITLQERKAQIIRRELPTIATSEPQLFVILKNLVENGLKYNQSATPVIEIGYLGVTDDKCHNFYVKDNGLGIDQKYQEKIFEMFFRLHARKDFEGSGLGLAIVKKTLAKLNGCITVKSEIDKGSTFEFSLPVVEGN